MDTKKALFAVLLTFLVIGQLTELDFQKVPIGGKIKQFCVVQIVSDTVHNEPCPDCTATLTMVDDAGFTYKNVETSLDESNGLFTNELNEPNLNTQVVYTLKHFCTSPTYGNGTVLSQLVIAEPTVMVTTAEADILEGSACIENPSALVIDIQYLTCRFSEMVGSVVNGLGAIAVSINEGQGLFGFSLSESFGLGIAGGAILGTISSSIGFLAVLMTNPFTAPFVLAAALASAITAVVAPVLGMFGVLIEMYIVFKVISERTATGMIERLVQENVKVLNFIYEKTMTFLQFLATLVPL